MAQRIDYDGVIAELEAEKARAAEPYEVAIKAMRQLKAARHAADSPVLFTRLPRAQSEPQREEREPMRFGGLSVAAAAEKFLSMMNTPQTSAQISEALRNGGIVSTSKKFTNLVYTRLYMTKDKFKRHGDKWYLKDWPLALGQSA